MNEDLSAMVALIERMRDRDRVLLADVHQALDRLEAARPGWGTTPKGPNAQYFGRLAWRIAHRERSGTCYWTDCSADAVQSHVLAAGTARSVIAEEGQVTTIRLRTKHPGVATLSVRSEDTTFPGYCVEHERMFSSFEDGSGFTTEQEIRLQAMRSTAREHWAAQEDLRYLRAFLQAQLTALERGGFDEFDMIDLGVRLSGPILELIDRVEWKATALQRLIDGLGQMKGTDAGTVVSRILPVADVIALSGSTRMHGVGWERDATAGKVIDDVLVLSVVPDGDSTRVILAGSDRGLVETYAERFLTDTDVQGLVTEWMTATEFWFVSPSWWDSLPEAVRLALVAAVERA